MKINKTFLLVSCALSSTQAFSAAFQLAEHSASGLGRAFAGEAAIAEDASVVARNPALMSQFDRSMFTVAGTFIKPDVSLKGDSAPAGIDVKDMDQSSIAPSAVVPAMYYVRPINDKVALGFGAFSNFGLSTEFDDDYAAGQLAGKTSITTINLNSSISYKVNEQLSVGAGLNVIYADAEVTRHFGETHLLPPMLTPPAETEAVRLEGDDITFGWNVGMSYDINSNHRIGLSYRSEVDVDFEGDYSNELPTLVGGLNGESKPGRLSITLPAIAELSGLHSITDTFALHYSVLWTGWSSFDKLEAYIEDKEGPVFTKVENFSDSVRIALGGTYQYSDTVKVRAGIAYDESPADDNHLSISIPDSNRIWLSSGVNYTLSDQSSIDFGVTYIKGEKESFTEKDSLGQDWSFTSEGNATLVSLQYNHAY